MYCSDACLALSPKGYEAMEKLIKQDNIESLDARSRIKAGDGSVLFVWNGARWTRDDDEIRFVMEFMDSIDSRDYLFARVGEYMEDIEVWGSFWPNPFDMCLQRRITFTHPVTGAEEVFNGENAVFAGREDRCAVA